MLRFTLSAVAFAGTLAMQSAYADPLASGSSDHAAVVAGFVEQQPLQPAPASTEASGTTGPTADAKRNIDVVPFGFGWG
jgi:hypothetical protein